MFFSRERQSTWRHGLVNRLTVTELISKKVMQPRSFHNCPFRRMLFLVEQRIVRSFKEVAMKIMKPAALAWVLPFCCASAASAAPSTLSGSPALALAAVVAAHSPVLSPAQRKAVAAIFNGKGAGPYKDKVVVTADKIVCRAGNVDITARSCELTFDKKTETFAGREANELYATEVYAGVPSDGAAGKIFESVSKLKCTLDPQAIAQNDGSGADCSYEPAD
jgi:hypothetical protein